MSSEVAERRRRLWDGGFKPVPLLTREKHTLKRRWTIPEAPGPVDDAYLNTGILAAGLRIVDIDIGDQQRADEVLALAETMLGKDAPLRWRENSPRCALVFRAAEGEPVKRLVQGPVLGTDDAGKAVQDKVEVLGRGQQLHAFGPHPSGADLIWEPAPPGDVTADALPSVTEAQVDAFLHAAARIIGAAPERVPEPAPAGANTADPLGAIEDVRAALALIPNTDSTSWEDWSNVSMAVWRATEGSDDGLDAFLAWSAKNDIHDETVAAEKWEHLSKSPPDKIGMGTLVHMARKIDPEFRKPTDAAALFTAVQTGDVGIRMACGRFTIVDPLADDQLPDPEWLIPDLIQCATYVMVVGAPGSFKTFLALDIALSVAVGDGAETGRAWPVVSRPGAVLFAAGEGGAGIKTRRRAWETLHHGGKPVPNFFRASAVPQITNEADAMAFVAAAKAAHPAGFRMVVIDTAMRAMQGQNSNSQEAASALTKLVGMIAAELAPDDYGCVVLVLHHPGQAKDAQDKPAGSFVFVGDPDTLLGVARADKAMTATVSMTKQKDAPEWEIPHHVALEAVGASLAAVACPTPPAPAQVPAQPSSSPFKPVEESPSQRMAKLSIVRTELTAMFEGNPTRVWEGDREVSRALSNRLAKKGEKGFGEDNLRLNYLPPIRDDGYELYTDGVWGLKPILDARKNAVTH